MKRIRVYKNISEYKYSLVDDEDYEWLSSLKWRLAGKYGHYYAQTTNASVYMHHLVFLIKRLRRDSGLSVNHKNYNTLDNRSCNLEIIDYSRNCGNRRNSLK